MPWGEKQAFKYVVDGGAWFGVIRTRWGYVLTVIVSQNGKFGRMKPKNGVSPTPLLIQTTGTLEIAAYDRVQMLLAI